MSKDCIYKNISFVTRFLLIILFSIMLYIKQVMYHPYNMNNTKIGVVLGISVILTSWTLLISKSRQVVALLIIDFVISVIIFSDKVYFRYYNAPISVSVLYQIGLVSSVFDSIKSLFRLSDIYYFLDVLIIIPSILYFRNKKLILKRSNIQSKLLTRIIAFLICILLSSVPIFYKVNQLIKSNSGLLTSIFNNNYIEFEMGILSFHIIDGYKYINDNILGKDKISDEDIKSIEEHFSTHSNTSTKKYYGSAQEKNVIILQVEALQAFVINKQLNGIEITPNLNKLIKESTYYSNYYSQVSGGNTSDAEFLTNNSLFPAKEGAVYFKYPMNKYNSLPQILKREGYFTAAMHGYSPEFWNRQIMYKALGFDKFYSSKDYKTDQILGMGIGDKEFLSQSLDKLTEMPKPFYSFLITLTSHYPFNALESNNDFDVKDYKETLLGNYFKSINYTDAAIGEFIDGLKQKGLYDNSIIVIYGDHDAIDLGHYNELEKFLGQDKNTVLLHENRRIPLIIHNTGILEGNQNSIIGGEIDTLPTILNLLGIDNKYFMGNDMNNISDNLVVFRDGSFIEKDHRYLSNENKIYSLTSNKSAGLENHKNIIDESINLLWISDKIMQNNLLKEYLK